MVLSHCTFKLRTAPLPKIAFAGSCGSPTGSISGPPDKNIPEHLFPNGMLDPLPQQPQGQKNCGIIATILSALNNPWARTHVLPDIFDEPTGIRLYKPNTSCFQRETIPITDEEIREVEQTIHGPLGWQKLMAALAKMRMKTEPGKFTTLTQALQLLPKDKIYFMLFGQRPTQRDIPGLRRYENYLPSLRKALDEIATDFDNYILTTGMPSKKAAELDHCYAITAINPSTQEVTLRDPYCPSEATTCTYPEFIETTTGLDFIQLRPKPCLMMKFKSPNLAFRSSITTLPLE